MVIVRKVRLPRELFLPPYEGSRDRLRERSCSLYQVWRVAREIQQGKDERAQASTDKVPVVEYKHHSREVNHSLQSNVDTLPVLSFRFLRYLELKGL